MAQPQPKTAEIADLLNAELHRPRSDEFSLRRLEREIASLLKSTDSNVRSEALSLSGALAALRFDLPSARRYYEQALAATGNAAGVYLNFASVLLSMGIASEALVMIDKAVAKSPDDPMVLRLAVRAAGTAFELEKVTMLGQRLSALKVPDDGRWVQEAIDGVNWQRALLESPGVTRPALLERYERARRIAIEHRVRVPHERATSTLRGTLIEWVVDCEAREIAQMNFEVAVSLAELPPDPCESLISFGFSSLGVLTPLELEQISA